MLQIQQGSHQPNRQTRPPRSTYATNGNYRRCAEKAVDFHYFTLTVLTFKSWGKRCFDLRPRQSICQHHQGRHVNKGDGMDDSNPGYNASNLFHSARVVLSMRSKISVSSILSSGLFFSLPVSRQRKLYKIV